jgi:hypothetical protein
MPLARAASTDGPGHNDRDSSSSTGSGQPGVAPFVCVHCTSTGQRSSCSLQVFLNRGAVRRHCQSGQRQNLNYLRATVTPGLWPLAGPGLPSQGPPGQVTRKVREALRGPRRMSDTSRQVTVPSSAVILVYNLCQREQ